MKKIEVYKDALERIAKITFGTDDSEIWEIANGALNEGTKGAEAEREAILSHIQSVMISEGLIFSTAEEIAEGLNKHAVVTQRGKPWTKATVTRLLGEVRLRIQAELSKPKAAVAAETEIDVTVVSELTEDAELNAIADERDDGPFVPVDLDELNELDELDQLEDLIKDVVAA